MYYQLISSITIQQVPTVANPTRKLKIFIPFLVQYKAESTWERLTDTLSITIPKGVMASVTDPDKPSQNNKIRLANIKGQYSNLGGFTAGIAPLFLAGDMITFNVGYRGYPGGVLTDVMAGTTAPDGSLVIPYTFKGFIKSVDPKQNFTLECEDEMWLCKQIPTQAKQYPSNYSLQDVVKENLETESAKALLDTYKKYGVNITLSKFSTTQLTFNIKNFITRGESVAELLYRIKNQYKLDSYFRNGELRVGLLHYEASEAKTHTFTFQKNIISDDLKWRRLDDMSICLTVKSIFTTDAGGTTTDGQPKTKQTSIEILIYWDVKKGAYSYKEKKKGEQLAEGYYGERHEIIVNGVETTAEVLFNTWKPTLRQYFYEGFRGSFTTFAIPHVKHGDIVKLVNPMMPEFNGSYMVKKVSPHGDTQNGFLQTIHLDYKI